ncbi:BTAD domain-containing putative transcriptional regulator [Streptomyces sp. NPDC048590]|uniref:AfsR/SARP family transcriptional regulator n=1 Tax=Streptomyces sp. NPDC048590 TaxID=3365574 RepID=UPI003712EFE2
MSLPPPLSTGTFTGAPGTVYFSLLGPLTAESGGVQLPLGPRKQRLVLATLLTRPNSPVPVEVLTDVVWPEGPPRTARKNLQVYMSAARALFAPGDGGDRLVHGCGGYRLRVEEGELDTLRFRTLTRAGRAAGERGDLRTAARLLREALDLWGERPPLHDLRDSAGVAEEAERLESRCLTVYEDWAEAEIETGRAGVAVDGLRDLVERHPFRERLRAAWMNSLHQTGRQAEALAVYDDYRQLLARELGLEPSPAMAALYKAVLGRRPASGSVAPRGAASGASLPADSRYFTGREDELARVLEVSADPEGATLIVSGPAGVGKSAVAVRAAHLLADRFPDGRVHVRARRDDGTARTAADMLDELGRVCGVPGRGRPDATEAENTWQDWLSERRVLIVLDDVADEGPVRGLLPRSGRSSVLLTARGQLAGLAGVHRVALGAPEEDEALELLEKLIGPGRALSDPASALRIVRACGSLPLAVVVSGMRLTVLRHLPLSEYAERLEDSPCALDELVAGDVSVRARLAAGWRDLSPEDRRALTRLSVLAGDGGFTLERATDVLGCPRRAALRSVESLIGTGAVTSPPGEVTAHAVRYEVPRLLGLYAVERAPADGGGGEAASRAVPGSFPERALPLIRG